MSETGEKLNRVTEASNIYSENIRPNDVVVVVGPSSSLLHDATLLFVSHLVRDGTIYVADPITRSDPRSYDEMEKAIGGKVTGIGDVSHYLSELNALKNAGMRLSDPKWLGPESAAQKIPLPDNFADLIVDHNTSVFLAGLPDETNVAERKRILQAIYSEYHRVLKPLGKVLLQTSNVRYQFDGGLTSVGLLERVLAANRFSVIKQKVEDVVKIPIEGKFYDAIFENDDYKSALARGRELLWFLNKRLKVEDGQNVLEITNTDHKSDDFYVATKT